MQWGRWRRLTGALLRARSRFFAMLRRTILKLRMTFFKPEARSKDFPFDKLRGRTTTQKVCVTTKEKQIPPLRCGMTTQRVGVFL